MNVLVCGSRTWPDEGWHSAVIWGMLDGLYTGHALALGTMHLKTFTLIEGGAKGADAIASSWARTGATHPPSGWIDPAYDLVAFKHLEFPADWDKYGKSAGSIRNKQMLIEGRPDVVIAFRMSGGSRGTDMMVNIAHAAGVPTFVVTG